QPGGETEFRPIEFSLTSTNAFEQTVAHMRRFGGEIFTPAAGAGTKCTLDSPPCQQAVRWFYDLNKAGLNYRRSDTTTFAQGRTAFRVARLAGERVNLANAVQGNFAFTFDLSPFGPSGT